MRHFVWVHLDDNCTSSLYSDECHDACVSRVSCTIKSCHVSPLAPSIGCLGVARTFGLVPILAYNR